MAARSRKTRQQNVVYANFICKFGNDINLLDLAEEVVLPAFFDRGLERTYGEDRHFIHGAEIVELASAPERVLGIVGRVVKETQVVSDQYYNHQEDKIEEQEVTVASAPTSVFLLVLNDHRLIYSQEVAEAPGIGAFETTMTRFLRETHRRFIDRLYEAAREKRKEDPDEPRVLKKDLLVQYPRPDLNIILLSSGPNIAEYLRKFRLLRSITFQLVTPNDDEFPANTFFGTLDKERSSFDASQLATTLSNPSGLNTEVAANRTAEAMRNANTKVQFAGLDEEGEALTGGNEEIKVQEKLPLITRGMSTLLTAGRQMWDGFRRAVRAGRVSIDATSPDTPEKQETINNIYRHRDSWNTQGRSGRLKEEPQQDQGR